jgi:hypothetical protein
MRTEVMMKQVLVVVWMFLAVGCAPKGEIRTFDLEVTNGTSTPVTLGLAKVDGPMEVNWDSPEDRAMMDPWMTGKGWGNVLPPGRTASIAVKGEFFLNTRGFLRAYRGDLKLSDVLAISKGSPNRVDLQLFPGKSTVVIVDDGPVLSANVTEYVPPPPPPK